MITSPVTLTRLWNHRHAQLAYWLDALVVADDNGYQYSEDGRGEIRYITIQRGRAHRSIRRIERWAAAADVTLVRDYLSIGA